MRKKKRFLFLFLPTLESTKKGFAGAGISLLLPPPSNLRKKGHRRRDYVAPFSFKIPARAQHKNAYASRVPVLRKNMAPEQPFDDGIEAKQIL